ncbi:HPGDS-like protein [Mya arenaria]|uniref:glutathione transferase n=1 Tax=Mya arenaria TaxID=6604 RepID=A0ABY7FVX2_MYAAR|nr:HPGDS-like protein [Mya arenaria]
MAEGSISTTMPSYKLTYFNVRGRAELARYLFLAAGRDFEDYRIQREDWPELKPKTTFGQLPILEVDGEQLAQSNAIARYLAREFDMAGENSWEQALCDQTLELINDLIKELVAAELQKNAGEVVFPKFLGIFESMLAKNGKYLVGSGLTVADLALYAVFDTPLQNVPNMMDKTPKLKAHRAMIEAIPKINEYISKREKTDI